ncbi:NADPH2:quinone reductase [Arboricoccus pini]|uniref:NADPH2:quinone reductase n=1 Tax=Arboricoccus pini TaxID=1963835 RepID=A0A212R9A2_9PROT|nr:quinone oxidoreductase [Arboricoccus pini]SNB68781.1 NADPH2:quinone reductase [Arboricoccus pini]
MATRIIVKQTGGPEALESETFDPGQPGEGQVRLRQTAIGLNFIDTYYRSGLYPAPGGLPMCLGGEGAGVIEAVGPGVEDLQVGQRVAYGTVLGAYASERLAPAAQMVPIPDGVDDATAAAIMLKGMTAHYLLHTTYPLKSGETILFHAAVGGVGLIAVQWAKALGATVIGTVGSKEKAELALAHGVDHVILYKEEDVARRVIEITGGQKLPVVYDGVGKDTFMGSLDSLAVRGLLVSFGNASGAIENFNVGILNQKGSLYITRPALNAHTRTREELLWRAGDLFEAVANGTLKIQPPQTFKLADVAAAHRALESRATTGSTVLIP